MFDPIEDEKYNNDMDLIEVETVDLSQVEDKRQRVHNLFDRIQVAIHENDMKLGKELLKELEVLILST
jgi:hypothetical protein